MRRAIGGLIALLAVQCVATNGFGQGFVMPAVGPINRSMGGAATAAPLDSIGALNWNPATISGLSQSRMDIGVDTIYNRNTVHTGLFIGTPGEISGTSDSDVGVWNLPSIGVVYRPQNSDWTYGLGITAIGGFATNYAASASNPLFMPPPVGFGHMYSRLCIMQIAPTLSGQLTDRLAFGFGPTFDAADAQVSPFPFDAPNPPGIYPAGTGNRNVWGLGAQAGLFYETGSGLNLGASVKSPQWFERLEVNSTDAAGFGRELTTQFEYPMIVSLGAAYDAIDNVLLAVDVRYIDFDSTELFGEPAQFKPTGALRGLGWESVWLVCVGGQVQVTDRLALRAGYSYNQNPIPERLSMFNVLAPSVYQHVVNFGGSLQLTDSLVGSLTYVHAFDHTISGPFIAPPGIPVPASRVAISQTIDALVLGLSVLF
jgi:long-chain fatty acid transport protein